MWVFRIACFGFFVAHSFGKRCPSFSKTLPMFFKNDGQRFSFPWATNFAPTGNGFFSLDSEISLAFEMYRG